MHATQRPIHIKAVHQDHAPTPHRRDPLTTEPHTARILRGETEFLSEFLDGAPAAELTRAIRAVERTRALLRLRCERLRVALHDANASRPKIKVPR